MLSSPCKRSSETVKGSVLTNADSDIRALGKDKVRRTATLLDTRTEGGRPGIRETLCTIPQPSFRWRTSQGVHRPPDLLTHLPPDRVSPP